MFSHLRFLCDPPRVWALRRTGWGSPGPAGPGPVVAWRGPVPQAQAHGLCPARQPAFAMAVPLRLSGLHCLGPAYACCGLFPLFASSQLPRHATSGLQWRGSSRSLWLSPHNTDYWQFPGLLSPPAFLPELVAGPWSCLWCIRVPLFLLCLCHSLGAGQTLPRLLWQSFLLGLPVAGISGLAALAHTSIIWSVGGEQMQPGPRFVCMVFLARSPCDGCPYGYVTWLPCV